MQVLSIAGIPNFRAVDLIVTAVDNCFRVGGNALGCTFVKSGGRSQTAPGGICHFKMAWEQPSLFKSLEREFRTAGVRRAAQDNIHQH